MKTTGEERLRKSGMSEADIKIFMEDRERAKKEMDLFLKEQEEEDKERERLKKERLATGNYRNSYIQNKSRGKNYRPN